MPDRVLITGGAGLLGSTLLRLAPGGVELHATRRRSPVRGGEAHDVELSEAGAVRRLIDALRPALVVHTAYGKENPERDIAAATRAVVDACRDTGTRLLHMSSDALLDGETGPYAEAAEPSPVHDYGHWKAVAERYVRQQTPDAAVVRTSLVVRTDPPDPASRWVLEALREGRRVRLFADEIRCPILVDDLARQVWEIVSLAPAARAGVWHLAGPEALSRYALGLLLARAARLDPTLLDPVPSVSAPAPRPRDLRLLTRRADAALRTRARAISAALAGFEAPPVAIARADA